MANKKKRVSAVKVEEAVTPQAPQTKKAKTEAKTPASPNPSTSAGKRRQRGKINAELKEEAGEIKPKAIEKAPKNKNKVKNVKVNNSKSTPKSGADTSITAAYLNSWKNDKPNWRFQKKQQHWLCRNVLDTEKLTDENFDVAMEYFEVGRGNVFNVLCDETQKRADELKKKDELDQNQSDRIERVMKLCKAKKAIKAAIKTKRENKKVNAANKKATSEEPKDDEEGSEEGEEDEDEGDDEEDE